MGEDTAEGGVHGIWLGRVTGSGVWGWRQAQSAGGPGVGSFKARGSWFRGGREAGLRRWRDSGVWGRVGLGEVRPCCGLAAGWRYMLVEFIEHLKRFNITHAL